MPWVDAASVEMHLTVIRAFRVLNAVAWRQIASLGLGHSLNSARCTVLRILYFAEDGRLPPIEISREMGVSRTNITNLIDGLEKEGLVVRAGSVEDRRVFYAQLTPAGEEVCATMLPVMARFIQETCSDFSLAEKRTMTKLLLRFQRNVAAYCQDNLVVDASFGYE